jgi:folate-dependent phosphoribosylglycinamide formyltransferase PurN
VGTDHASFSLALVTSNPRLLGAFLEDRDRRIDMGIEIPLVLWVRPSMKFSDRLHDLRRTVVQRRRINGVPPWTQVLHHFVYRCVSRAALPAQPEADDASLEDALRRHHDVRVVRTVNAPEAIEALSDPCLALGVVLGADVFRRDSLQRIATPLYNIHLGDPRIVRGKPPVFWEIYEGLDEVTITLHRVVPRLDAGPVVAQRSVPIEWGATLVDTLRRTRRALPLNAAELLFDTLPSIVDGSASGTSIAPGPLRTNPTTRQAIRAHRMCSRGRTKPTC